LLAVTVITNYKAIANFCTLHIAALEVYNIYYENHTQGTLKTFKKEIVQQVKI